MCTNQTVKRENLVKEDNLYEQNKTEDMLNQGFLAVGQESEGNLNSSINMQVGVQKAEEYLHEHANPDELFQADTVQIPKGADLETKKKGEQLAGRTDKSRRKHREKSERLYAKAMRKADSYIEMRAALDSSGERSSAEVQRLEEDCFKSGIEGIRFLAEAERERIKASGEKDTEEMHKLANNELQKNMSLQNLHQQMLKMGNKHNPVSKDEEAWKTQRTALYEGKIEEYDKLIKKQREVVERSGVLSKAAEDMKKVKAEIGANKEPISIKTLTYQDFVKMIGTYNRGQVAFSEKGLTAINNGKFATESNEESKENLQIRQRFLAVIMKRMGGKDKMREEGTEELFALACNQLGLNDGELTQAKPLSRRLIQDIISRVNESISIVGKNLKVEKPLSVAEVRIAKNVDEILGGQTEKEKEQDITSILKVLKEYGGETFDLNKHQMDNLLKGNLPLLRDEIFESVNKICKQIKNGESGDNGQNAEVFNVDRFLADKETMKLIAASHIQKMVAGTEAGAMLANRKLESYINQIAFSYAQPNEKLQENVEKMDVNGISLKGSEDLELRFEEKLEAEEEKSVKEFKELCDNIKLMNDLRKEAFAGGLSAEKVIDLKNAAIVVDAALSVQANIEAFDKLGKKLEGTRFLKGYEQVKELVLTKGFSFIETIELITATKGGGEKTDIQAEENKQGKNSMDILSGNARSIGLVLSGQGAASGFITQKKEEPFAQALLKLRDFLDEFKNVEVLAKTINIEGQDIVFVQDSKRILKMFVGNVGVSLGHSAVRIAEHLESEIILNDKSFSKETIEKILGRAESSAEKSAEIKYKRRVYLDVLKKKTGKTGAFFDNVSSETILGYVKRLIVTDTSKKREKEATEKLPNIAEEIIAEINKVENINALNGEESKELIKLLEKESWFQEKSQENAKVTMEKGQTKEVVKQERWNADEQKVVTLFAELISSNDSWATEELQGKPGMRVQKVMISNVKALRLLIQKPKLQDAVLDRMPLGNEEKSSNIKSLIKEQLEGLLSHPATAKIRGFGGENDEVEEDEEEKVEEKKSLSLIDLATKNFRTARNKKIETGLLEELNKPERLDEFAKMETKIEGGIGEQSEQIQEMISQSLESVYGEGVNEQVQPIVEDKTKTEKKTETKTADGLKNMIEKSMKGETGQGLFIKNVFKSYFTEGNIIDKRAMFASALRYSVPKKILQDTATAKERQQEEERAQGSFIGGFLKGAGPLMQKTLQGVQQGIMPPVIDHALKDMKSSLAPIPQKYVDAQLNGMVNRSVGEITRIHILKSLGAASVGQAFLCKMFGPRLDKKGKEVVIKLLRPDVRNRIEREKKVMLKAAAGAGEGMEATYRGQLKRIEEELDLTIEAENAQSGEIYNNARETVKSVEINGLVEPTVSALVLEKAPGTTVDRYITEVRAKKEETVSKFYGYKEEKGKPKTLELDKDGKRIKLQQNGKPIDEVRASKVTLIKELKKLQERQKYLITMAKSWVTEGIYGKGFYHGDLHAGNMMIDDKGLTLIDFGNATQLDDGQKTQILRMMAAAAAGETFAEIFQEAFHQLLGENAESLYQKNKDQLGEVFQDILQHGKQQDAGLRICAALVKAQDLGVEVPAAIYNFSQSQMRLQNTIEEMNGLITSLQGDIENLDSLESLDVEKLRHKGKPLKMLDLDMEFNLDKLSEVDKEEFLDRLDHETEKSFKATLHAASYKEMGEAVAEKVVARMKMAEETLEADHKKNYALEIQNVKDYPTTKHMLENFGDYRVNYFANRTDTSVYNMCGINQNPDEFKAGVSEITENIRKALTANPQDIEKVRGIITAGWSKLSPKMAAMEAELQEKLREYRQGKTKASPENLNKMKEGIYHLYEKMGDAEKMTGSNFKKIREAFRNTESTALLEKDLADWFEFEKETNGGEARTLEKAYEDVKKALKENNPEIMEKEAIFFRKLSQLIQASVDAKTSAQEKGNEGRNKDTPYDFMDVMGTVISENALASLGSFSVKEALDLQTALKQ